MAQQAADQSWIVAHSMTVRRYTANGQRDTQFVEGTTNAGGVISTILAAPDETGDIYIAGTFDSYNGVPAGNLVRISSSGVRR